MSDSDYVKVIAGVLSIIFYIGISIAVCIYNFPKLIRKMEEKKLNKIAEEEKKKEVLKKFIRSCEH